MGCLEYFSRKRKGGNYHPTCLHNVVKLHPDTHRMDHSTNEYTIACKHTVCAFYIIAYFISLPYVSKKSEQGWDNWDQRWHYCSVVHTMGCRLYFQYIQCVILSGDFQRWNWPRDVCTLTYSSARVLAFTRLCVLVVGWHFRNVSFSRHYYGDPWFLYG